MVIFKPRILQVTAWFCLGLLAYLSLIPAEFEIRTGAPGGFEHFVAYFGTALLFGLGYTTSYVRVALGLVVYGSLMEFLQFIPPDRHPSILDAASSGTGALLGILTTVLITRHISRGLKKPPPVLD